MVKKVSSEDGKSYTVTFELPAEVRAQSACLCGEFNDWEPTVHHMQRREDGSFILTVALESGRAFRFRYFLDEVRWENDWNADRYEANPFGSEDSVIDLTNGKPIAIADNDAER